jgi:hypothetical protein
MRCQGEISDQSAGAQEKLTVRKVLSGCGIMIVTLPSVLHHPVTPLGEPLGFWG